MSGELYTDEQARFIFFYSTLTVLNAHSVTNIFNSYFNLRIGPKNMQYAMDNIAYNGQYDQETIALCDEAWSDPRYFGYNPVELWKT